MAADLAPDAVRAGRRRLGLTQVQFAARVGCTPIAVSYWERGTRTPTGLYARAVVFSLVGIFFVHAAWTFDSAKAVGLDGALRKIITAPGGYWWLEIVAAGLAAFGIFSLAQARYRSVMNS